MEKRQFESEINWQAKHKLGKMKLIKGKKGDFIMGDFGNMFKLMISKDNFQNSKPEDYTAYLVPVTYKKVEQKTFETPGDNQEIPF